MYELYSDKNELFEAKIELDGASLTDTSARLVMNTDMWNLVFEGDIDSVGNVEIPINKLKSIFPGETKGKLRLEVIADDTYFEPWSDEFQLKRSKNVMVEVKDKTKKSTGKKTPKVTVKEQKKGFKKSKSVMYFLEEALTAYVASKKSNIKKDVISETTIRFAKAQKVTDPSKVKQIHSILSESKDLLESVLHKKLNKSSSQRIMKTARKLNEVIK